MIDLHLHTTASDGRSTPEALVAEAVAAGIRTIAVTDHDTLAGLPAAEAAARRAGIGCVAGIEITAVHAGKDIHVLGYFLNPADASLTAFLEAQREDRRRRVLEIVGALDRLGLTIDPVPLLASREGGKSVGRPLVAAAIVAGGHAKDIADAFDRYLSEGRPGFIERRGSSPRDVVALIRSAGGVASLAHPGKTRVDPLLGELIEGGLEAIEVFHPDHSPVDIRRYRELASKRGLVVTGGSDYHGPGSGRSDALGRVGVNEAAFAALQTRAAR